MTDKPLCPKCGRPLVWLSSPQAWKCFKCQVPPEPEEPMPWWTWVLVVIGMGLAFGLIIMVIDSPPGSGGGLTNLTTAVDQVKEDSMMIIFLIVVMVLGIGAGYLNEKGKERCPDCGEAMRVTPTEDFYCFHCRKLWDRDDIVVEVVE